MAAQSGCSRSSVTGFKKCSDPLQELIYVATLLKYRVELQKVSQCVRSDSLLLQIVLESLAQCLGGVVKQSGVGTGGAVEWGRVGTSGAVGWGGVGTDGVVG